MAEAHAHSGEGRGPGLLSNAIALIAFILVMAIVIWGLLHVVSLSSSWFSSTFTPRASAPAAQKTTLPSPIVTSAPARNTPSQGSASETAPAPVYHGPADVVVRIVSVVPGNPSTVEFDIGNEGGSPSGAYTFSAILPTDGGYVYQSPMQYSLGPGDHIVNTLRFSQSQGGTVTIVVHANDANQSNNTASHYIDGGYYPTYQYDYPQYQYQPDPYYYPQQYYDGQYYAY